MVKKLIDFFCFLWPLAQKEKSKVTVLNVIQIYQFTANISQKGSNLDVFESIKLLGTIIQDVLRLNKNTEFLVKKANARMRILPQ